MSRQIDTKLLFLWLQNTETEIYYRDNTIKSNDNTSAVVLNLKLHLRCNQDRAVQRHWNVHSFIAIGVDLTSREISYSWGQWCKENLETCIRNSETRRLVARKATKEELENSAVLERRQESWFRFCIAKWFLFWSRRRRTTDRPGRVLTSDK